MRKYGGIFLVVAAISLILVAASSAIARQIITGGVIIVNGAFICLPAKPRATALRAARRHHRSQPQEAGQCLCGAMV
jgi:hypothetical protein